MRVGCGVKRSPSRVEWLVAARLPDVAGETRFAGTAACKLLLRIEKAPRVSAASHERITKLHTIVLPKANWADVVAARRLAENEMAAAGARMAVGHGL